MPNRLWCSLTCVLFLAACGTRQVAPPPPEATPAERPAPRPTLASEQARLADLFRGTPVSFTMQPDGSMRAVVPRAFSFDAGSSKVKPPLAAVLDRLVKSQLTTRTRLRVSAPTDPQTRGTALARDRALSVRDYLVGHGISPTRLEAHGSAPPADTVEVVVIESGL